MPFGKSRMRVAVNSIVATRWCFRRSRRPQTWIRKRLHTSHIQILFPTLLKKNMKGSVACKATTGVLYLFERARWSLVFAEAACMSPSFWYLCVIP